MPRTRLESGEAPPARPARSARQPDPTRPAAPGAWNPDSQTSPAAWPEQPCSQRSWASGWPHPPVQQLESGAQCRRLGSRSTAPHPPHFRALPTWQDQFWAYCATRIPLVTKLQGLHGTTTHPYKKDSDPPKFLRIKTRHTASLRGSSYRLQKRMPLGAWVGIQWVGRLPGTLL